MTVRQFLTRKNGHPWDGATRPNFDWLEIDCDTKDECDAFVEKAKEKFWQPWLIGQSEHPPITYGGLLYKPSGIDRPWEDTLQSPHPGGK